MHRKLICFCLISIAVFFANPIIALADNINGEAIFTANCAGCHPKGGNIIRRGKNLKLKTLQRNHLDSVAAISKLVSNGKGNMSAYSDRLSPQEIKTVANYVLAKADQNWK